MDMHVDVLSAYVDMPWIMCCKAPRAPRPRHAPRAQNSLYIYLPPEEGTSDERAKKDTALLSTARPTSLASEPNHSGGVAGCTHEKGVRAACRAGEEAPGIRRKEKERKIYL